MFLIPTVTISAVINLLWTLCFAAMVARSVAALAIENPMMQFSTPRIAVRSGKTVHRRLLAIRSARIKLHLALRLGTARYLATDFAALFRKLIRSPRYCVRNLVADCSFCGRRVSCRCLRRHAARLHAISVRLRNGAFGGHACSI